MQYGRRLVWIVFLCLIAGSMGSIAGQAKAGTLNEGELTSFLLFDLMFREAANGSEDPAFEHMHVFAPMYSDGYWVRAYYFGDNPYMRVLTTSPDTQGRVCRVDIVSMGEAPVLYDELCAYAAIGLAQQFLAGVYDALAEGGDMDNLMAELGLEAAGYTYRKGMDAPRPYIALEAVGEYEVEGYLAIPTDEPAMYPFALEIDKQTYVGRLARNLQEYYGFAADALTHMQSVQMDEEAWLHMYVVTDILVAVITDGEDEASQVTSLYALDMGENLPLLVAMGQAMFGAMVDFDMEQHAAMGLLAGPFTTFDDFLSFLPAVAHGETMLVFGLFQGNGGAYVMGVPEG